MSKKSKKITEKRDKIIEAIDKKAKLLPVETIMVPVKYRKLRSKFLLVIFAFMICYSVLIALVLAFVIKKNYLLAAAKNPLILILGIYLLSFLISTVLTVYVVRTILKPIEELSEASKQVSEGDFDIRVKANTSAEEIHNTCESFNKMVEALGSLETLRNDFIANVSHEFKTPLSAISGYASLLLQDDITGSEKREYADKILLSTSRLSDLTGNILLLSKLENQGFDDEKKLYSLDEQIRQSILLLEPKWEEKHIDFDLDKLDDTQFFGCEALMQLVFINLIGNAIKFSDDCGTVAVSIIREDGFILVTVEDHGIGMTEETIKHIFEKFYQGDTSHRTSGNGLGLALCKAILDRCGGSISVKSSPGKGSSFTVALPEY